MSHWKRLSQKQKAFYMGILVLALATTAWASGRYVSLTDPDSTAAAQTRAEALKAPFLAPEAVFIQATSEFGELGNVLVTVRLTAEQLAGKEEDGTRDFVVLGNPDAPVILRDDGRGGDRKTGDGTFSGPAFVSDSELQARGESDRDTFNDQPDTDRKIPLFKGRAAVDVTEPVPFDIESFKAGQAVRLGPAVAFLQPESESRDETDPDPKSGLKISSPAPVALGTNPFQEKVLIIRNVNVVTDPARTIDPCTNVGNPNGVWTFKHLVTEMANEGDSGINPSDFVENWLKNWNPANPLTINNDAIPSRAQMNTILNQWPRISGKLDLDESPLRLLAILPRIDLRRTASGGGYSNASGAFLDAGEVRFVFGFVGKPGWNLSGLVGAVQIPGKPSGCRALPFTVIFEYRVPKCKCEDVRSWAQQWRILAMLEPSNANYRNHLQVLTESFVAAGSNPRNPNGSALGQLRTNEVALQAPWELREFQLTQFPFTFLQETTVEDTPQDIFNNVPNPTTNPTLFGWNLWVQGFLSPPTFEGAIPLVPLFFPSGNNFMAGHSTVPDTPGTITHHWMAQGLNINVSDNPGNPNILRLNWARHRVSRAACNGCHRRETFTHFVHIDPSNTIPGSNPALPAEISRFLSGINGLGDPADAVVNGDPEEVAANGNPKRNFDDLARRQLDLQAVANMTCFYFHHVNVAHVQASIALSGRLPDNLFEGLAPVPVHQRVSVAVDDMTADHVTEAH